MAEEKENLNTDEQSTDATETEAVENAESTKETEEVVEVSEVDTLKAQLDEMEDKFLRAQAEVANISRRNKAEHESLVKYRSQDLGKKLLPVMDNLERALQTEVKDDQGASLKKGVEMVLESLAVALKEEGIKEIPAQGEAFDPNIHQAVQTIPASDDAPSDTIVEVLQKGYQLHDRVLRPAMVIVAQ